MGPGSGTERPLLERADVPVAADLTDDAGPDAGVADALGSVAHDVRRELVHGQASMRASSRYGRR